MNMSGAFKKAVNLLTLASFLMWNLAAAVPEGGQVAAGNAAITQSGSTTTINQTSQNTVINWQGFDTAQHEAVKFNQPNASSIALNRINSGVPTNFQGSLSANGQVWILNPSGVLFGANSKVDVAGLLVTTHNITDSNFMNGHYQFNPVVGFENSKIINNGLITAKDSGIVGLVAPWVENNGVIIAHLGKVHLASGSSFVLDMYGDSLINFGSSAPSQNGYVSNSGLIQADGGKVHMTARTAAGILDNVISMSGTIQANAVSTNQRGEIVLHGGSSGVTKVSGKLKATGGGFIETSGHVLVIEPTTVIDAANWLIDPADLFITAGNSNVTGASPFQPTGTVSTLDVGTLTAALALGNVTVQTNDDGFVGNGDIFVNAAVSWSAATSLTISAYRNITINNPITSTSGSSSLVLKANNAAAFLVGSGNGTVINNSTLTIAGPVTVFYNPPVAYTAPVVYTNTGGPVTAYMLVNNVTELQNLNTNLTGTYALNTNIDATSTINLNAGAGFVPIGAGSAATAFQGFFNGQNYIINGLYINRPTTNFVGLFGTNIGNNTLIQNVGLTNVNITGRQNVGGLIGQNGNGGDAGFTGGTPVNTPGNTVSNVSNVYVTGTVNSIQSTNNLSLVGGLIGYHTSGLVSNTYSTANVTASSVAVGLLTGVGGLIGDSNANITQSYASGNVTVTTPGSIGVGGFVGQHGYGTISQSYSSGNVTVGNGALDVGAFVGFFSGNPGASLITNSYSTGSVFANNSTALGGFVGRAANTIGTVPTISNSYSTGSIMGAGNTSIGGFGGSYITSGGAVTTTNNFFDTQSSGISTDPRSGLGVTARTTAQMMTTGTFSGATWSIIDVASTTAIAPAFTWFIFLNQTRPLLMMENKPTTTDPVVNAHQVQMMGAALGANYVMGANVDFNPAMNNIADVWATNRNTSTGQGFVPVGNSTNNFTGTLNGNAYIIDNIYIKSGLSQSVGLFGITNNAIIQKLSVTNASVTQAAGANAGGIIIGTMNGSSALSLSYASGAITNRGNTGGLVGNMSGTSSITDSYNIGSVTSTTTGAAGGIVGTMSAGTPSVTRTYNSGRVIGTGFVGGIVGNFAAGTRLNNYWDIDTSGVVATSGCGNIVSCLNTTGLTTAQSLLIGSYGGWSIIGAGTITATPPAFTWFIFPGQTRPMLMIENNPNIYNAHQLQMMGAALGGSYLLLHNIDMTSSFTYVPDVWVTNYNTPTGLGFLPVGAASASTAFQGSLNGQNYTINNLYINRPATDWVGLFGTNIGNGNTISNVGLTNVNITGRAFIGGLVGQNSNSNTVGFTGGTGVGLPGNTYSNISNVYVTGYVNSAGTNAGASLTGGLVGFNTFGTISNSYSTATVTNLSNGIYIGGLVGDNLGNITTSYSTGNVIATQAMTGVGGFVGHNLYGTISQSWSGGNIYAAPGSNFIGGFAADFNGSPIAGATNVITNSYSTANIYTSNSTNIGGFVGPVGTIGGVAFANISNSYSSGALIGFGNTTVGGFAPSYFASTVTTNNFWDTQSSGIATDPRSGLGVTGANTAAMQTLATFTGATWDINNVPSITSVAPNNIWFIFAPNSGTGNTRPMLMMENKATVVNAHELQMMGAALGGTYQLGSNIDFINGLTSVSDVWATNYYTPVGAGFVPIGSTTVATAFQGNFNGNNYTINNLYINRPTTNFVGLFGTNIGNGTMIQNVGLTHVNITGQLAVGGLIGQNGNGPSIAPLGGPGPVIGNSASNISNVYTTGSVLSTSSGFNIVGGLIAIHTSGTVSNSFSTANVTATSTATNVAGTNIATQTSGGSVGGLIGTNYGNVTQSYASGNVTMATPGAFIGGLLAFTYNGTVSQSYSSGTVTAANGSKWIGGFVGYEDSYPGGANTITNSYSVSNIVTSNSSVIGGFAGIINPQSTSPIISNSYSSGGVTGTGNTTVGGFLGQNISGTLTNDFWDTQSSGIATSAGGASVFGRTTAQMQTLSTFNSGGPTWDITNSPSTTAVAPNNIWFIFAPNVGTGLTRPILMMENNPKIASAHAVQMMGAALGGNYQLVQNIDMKPGLTNISDVWATNYNTPVGQGFVPVGYDANVAATQFTPQGTEFTGTFNGNGYNINNLYINNTPGYSTFGLFGATSGNVLIQNIGLVNVNIFGSNAIGGLVGNMIGTGTSVVSNAFVTGTVTSNIAPSTFYAMGGLIGHVAPLNGGLFTIQNSYSTATVNATANQTAGGFIGLAQAAYTNVPISTIFSTGIVNIINSYSTGSVTVGSGVVAGFSHFRTGAIVTNSFWDVVTSGRTNGYVTLVGPPTINGLYAGCFAGGGVCATQTITNATLTGSITPKDLSALGTYTTGGPSWSMTATSSTTATTPNFNWFVFPGQTRPLLMMENKAYVSSPHQLQMMGAALGGNYVLENTIDFTTVTSRADVWNTNFSTLVGNGFVPVGTAALPFSGVFNGEYNTVNALYINSPVNTNTGLFGKTYVTSNILAIGVTNANIIVNNTTTDGSVAAGILAGLNSGRISNSYVTGNITAGNSNYYTGGLVGNNVIFAGNISNSYSAANITSGTGTNNTGGFVGGNTGMINTSYSTGLVSVGIGSSSIGGFAGTASGDIRNIYSFSPVVANSSTRLGGLFGSFSSGTLQYAYAAGPIVGTGNTSVGGIIGLLNGGAVNNAVWDIGKTGVSAGYGSTSSGSISNVYGGCFGNVLCGTPTNATNATTYDLTLLANYTGTFGWTSGTVISASSVSSWNTVNAVSYPYLRAFYTTTPRFVTATSSAGPITITNLYQNGLLIDIATTGANGESYFLEGFNNISRVNHTVADNDLIFMDYPSAAPASNAIAFAPAAGGQMGANNGLVLNTNTVTVGLAGTVNTQVYNNTVVNTAKGALSGPAILYSLSGSNLIMNSGNSFATTTPSTYTVNGDITTTNGSITFNGPVIISAASPLVSTTTSGDISFNNILNGTVSGAQSLTISAAPSGAVRFKNNIGAITPLNNFNVSGNIINFDGVVTTITSTGPQVYTGTGVNPLMTIGVDPVFTAPSFVIAIPTAILADTTFNSTAGDIDFQFTVDGPANLILNPTGTAIFQGDVGATTPLASLEINGLLSVSGAAVINTDNYQTYGGLVTLNNNIVLTAGTLGCSTTNCVQFTLGTIGVDGITGPAFDLSIFTYDASKGGAGDGIAGTVNVANFTMGGTGGGNVSPNAPDFSTVGGSSGVGAWNNTVIDPAATGMYCVNGFCISGSRVLMIDGSNETKVYGQVITPNPVTDVSKITVTGLAPGDTITSIDLTSAGYPQTATVAGSTYPIIASNASGAGLANHYTAIIYNNTVGALTVDPAPLTVTADNVIKTYGQTVTFAGTEFSITSGTFYNGDNISSVSLNSLGASPTAGVLGSPYSITPSAAVGSGLSNYTITYDTSGAITVLPAALSITPDSIIKTYGDVISPTTSGFTPVGLQNGEMVGTITITSAGLAPTASVLGGPYAIVGSAATGGTFDPNNYTISYLAGGTITVNQAALTITSLSQNKLFGVTLSPTTTAFTPVGLQNLETIGTVDITSAGLVGSAPVGSYPITSVSNALGGTFNLSNYSVNYIFDGNIFVISSIVPVDTTPVNVPPTQEFVPPVVPNCGIAGCDNTGIIIVDILNGIGIREDIIIYPIGIPPELIYSPEESNVLGVVTDSIGAPSEATNSQGITRELNVGSVIYKDDQLMVGGTSCLGVKMISSDKKWLSDTKHDDQWKNSCQLNKYNTIKKTGAIKKVGAGYQPAQKNKPAQKPIIKHHSLMQMFSLLELPSMKTHGKAER